MPLKLLELLLLGELGILLYQRLRSTSAFRYGIVGVEVDEFRTCSELTDDLTVASLPGIVVDRDIWQLLGFQPRSNHYTGSGIPSRSQLTDLSIVPNSANTFAALIVVVKSTQDLAG
jgi:hypothetical protein